MKLKQHLIITNPENFAKGDYSGCFSLFNGPSYIDSWIDCGEIEIEVDVDRRIAVAICEKELDELEKRVEANYQKDKTNLERRRAELLALPEPELESAHADISS